MNKEESYKLSIEQIKALLKDEDNKIANYSNVAAVLKENHSFLWVGFYFVQGPELVLGPFQGPVACTRIEKGRGVCGKAWEGKKMINVPDVDSFPGHISCSALSKSEIVLPIFTKDSVSAILDVDSEEKSFFDNTDEQFLSILAKLLSEKNG